MATASEEIPLSDIMLTVKAKQTLIVPKQQRVFVVGDIHGNLASLKSDLRRAAFEPDSDVLISLGDIINRGPDSFDTVQYLRSIGALMVLGNHEQMLIESVLQNDTQMRKIWLAAGGKWRKKVAKKQLTEMAQWFLTHPLSIVLHYRDKKIGLSHTRPKQWDWSADYQTNADVIDALLWDKSLVATKNCKGNQGVDLSIHGHSKVEHPLWIGSSYHIDTSYFRGPTLIELRKVLKKLKRA
ncbi:metallophosphoesterase [Thalassotalea mangrovi]|uniref:Metallophosphoesterase n=1 Tax=Thalassotalea mangrovi TaxID=2572245 RepID=A0A4U1B2W6_9GAMM|nr:metallophosphoesterase [Thalassotalea mangrovi]TKB44004.1 metallophosphoesterase [Thalassotalea mangrovi]